MQDTKINKKYIEQFIDKNYTLDKEYTIDYINNEYIVNTNGNVHLKCSIKELTNNMFVWGQIGGDFDCSLCKELKTLEGGPTYVGNAFMCQMCHNLESLKGSPKSCRLFICGFCDKLKTLEGSPKTCDGFYCRACKNLESLKGSPEKVKEFNCSDCPNIKDLKYAPKEIFKQFICKNINIEKSELKNYHIKGKKVIK